MATLQPAGNLAASRPRSFKSVTEMLADDLRQAILSGSLEEGEYLRQQRVARQYSVSEVVVREALRVLEAEGLVETERRRGSRVSRLSPDEVRELWELRILLEKLLTRHAVPALAPDDLAHAAALASAMEKQPDAVAWLALNFDFHTCLYRPAGRPRILRFANNLRNVMDRYLRMRLAGLGRFELAHREHRQILTAYRRRDPDLAVQRVEAHLARTAEDVLAFLTARSRAADPPDRQSPQRG